MLLCDWSAVFSFEVASNKEYQFIFGLPPPTFFCFDLTEENKQFFEERSKAYQKLGTMSLCNDEMSAR